MCLVAFQKIFRKIFSGVWKRIRKTQIQKNTSHNPEKNHQRRQIQSDDCVVDRDSRSRSTARSRSRLLREIAIDGAILRSVEREISYVGERGRSEIATCCILAERSERKIRRGRSRDPRGRSVDRDLAFARSRRQSRSREEGEIAIDGVVAISPCRR